MLKKIDKVCLSNKIIPYICRQQSQKALMELFPFKNAFFDQLVGVEQKRYIYELKVIKYLYVGGHRTSTEICRHLKISAPNALSMLNDLIEKGVVEKKGRGDSIGGRKPDLYGVKDDAFYVMAVEMDVYTTRMAIFNAANENITGVREIPVTLSNDMETLEMLAAVIQQFIKLSGIDSSRLTGIGISMPGLIDSVHGINHTYLNFGDKPLTKLLEERLNRPVFIENDANAIALAEYRFGVSRSKKEVLVLYLDLGIGLGMILNGKLYKGFSGFAGEFSHIHMVDDGQLCRCGKLGCLETVASGAALVQMAKEGIDQGKSSIVFGPKEENDTRLAVKQVVGAALSGDQYAISIISEAGRNIGKGLSILIQILNPEQIVLSGVMAEAGTYLLMPVKQAVKTHSMNQLNQPTKIELSQMGSEIGLKGALAVVMENIFEAVIKNAAK